MTSVVDFDHIKIGWNTQRLHQHFFSLSQIHGWNRIFPHEIKYGTLVAMTTICFDDRHWKEVFVKELIAIIRPGQGKITKQKLAEQGFVAYTEEKVFGHGKQKGLQYSQEDTSSSEGFGGIQFLPKRMMTLFVNDEDLERVVAVFTQANKTGEIGDGKIFVCPVEETLRIRTDERNQVALA